MGIYYGICRSPVDRRSCYKSAGTPTKGVDLKLVPSELVPNLLPIKGEKITFTTPCITSTTPVFIPVTSFI